jgi:hypothetical protein
MAAYLSCHGILLKHFRAFAREATAGIKRDVTAQAEQLGRPVVFV